jgi:hypothetical protein
MLLKSVLILAILTGLAGCVIEHRHGETEIRPVHIEAH